MITVPYKITLLGDKEKARDFIGAAQSQMRILENQLSFQNLNQGVRRVQLTPGGVITESIVCFNLREVRIYCPPTVVVAAGGGYEKLSKLYVYVTISDYVTIWDLLTGEVAEDVCDNNGETYDNAGNPLITFPCHKDELVTWLKGIKDRPTRQVLKDEPEDNRDFLEDNGKDIGNENRTSDNPWDHFGISIWLGGCSSLDEGPGIFTNLVAEDPLVGYPTNQDWWELWDTIPGYPELPDAFCFTAKGIHESYDCGPPGWNPYFNWPSPAKPDFDGNPGDAYWTFEKGIMTGRWLEHNFEAKYIGDYGGVSCEPTLYNQFASQGDPCDQAHTKRLRLLRYGDPGIEGSPLEKTIFDELTMGREIVYLDDGYCGSNYEDATMAKLYYWMSSGYWGGGASTSILELYTAHKIVNMLYTYTTPLGPLIIDQIPVRELKKKFGVLDNYETLATKLRTLVDTGGYLTECSYRDSGVDNLEDFVSGQLEELTSYITDSCPQRHFYVEHDQGRDGVLTSYEDGAVQLRDAAIGNEKRCGELVKDKGVIGESNRFGVSWCQNALNEDGTHTKKYDIRLHFNMGRVRCLTLEAYREDTVDVGLVNQTYASTHGCAGVQNFDLLHWPSTLGGCQGIWQECPVGEDCHVISQSGYINNRISSVLATLFIANSKEYAKKNLTIENDPITVERPRRYERIATEDKNDDDWIYPFDGTYDIYTLGEAVEELINGHYKDGSDDQLLVYLYERPDMIKEEVRK